MYVCVSRVLEFIYEADGEFFDLVDIKFRRFLSEGHTLRCIQYEVKVNRAFCTHSKETKMAVSKYYPLTNQK